MLPRRTPFGKLLLVVTPILCAFLAISLMLATPTRAAEPSTPTGIPHNFNAHLSGAQEVPPVDSSGFGHAVLHLNSAGDELRYMINVRHLTNITAAHIHEGAPGTNGPVVFTIYDGTGPFDPQNPVRGVFTLTVQQRDTLLAGGYYINIHTAANPAGELRAQIGEYQDAPGDFHALLKGENENPPVNTPALGIGRLSLDGYTLTYQVDVADIVSITAAHLHVGQPDENGPVAVTLYTGTGTFDPNNPLTGTAVLTPGQLLPFMEGELYLNVHTDDHPSGEIRGQVGRVSLFEAMLSGDEEVPPVLTTTATGRAVLALTADASSLYYRVRVEDILSITAAHVHSAPLGTNGPVVFPLYTGTGTFDPDHPAFGVVTPTIPQLFDLVRGTYYVNVHTEAHPAGEIRGQIAEWTEPFEDHRSDLSGSNEVPPVPTAATGVGRLHLYRGTGLLQYYLRLNNIVGVTMAHIHIGQPGQHGPVRYTLYTDNPPLQPTGAPNDLSGGFNLDAAELVTLLTEGFYFNVHTTANPSGEIRGQISPTQGPTAVTLEGLATPTSLPIGWLWLTGGLGVLAGFGLALRRR